MRDDARMSMRLQQQQRAAGRNNSNNKSRPLGAVRIADSSATRFPPLPTPRPERQQLQGGIHGNAMSVPPQKLAHEAMKSEEKERPVHDCSHHKTSSSSSKRSKPESIRSTKSEDLQALEKARNDLKESVIRERELKQQIIQLRKDIDELRQQIWDKDKIIEDMKEQFVRQEEKYKEMYEKEVDRHKETKEELLTTLTQLTTCKEENKKLSKDFNQQITDLIRKHGISISNLEADKAKEISIRDEKLSKLKKQMADALQGNSWERQQQLDELSKELNKVQEEADMLRMRLKAAKQPKPGGGPCHNCDALAGQLTQAQKLAKEKEQTIQELHAKYRGGKMEKPTPRLDTLNKQSSRGKLK